MQKCDEKTFWEEVSYSTDFEFARQIVEKIFADQEIKGKSVLDVGCGTGVYSLVFSRKGARKVTGFDLSDSSIESARQTAGKSGCGKLEFLKSDVRNYDFAAELFDIVWCHGLIYYMRNPEEIMERLCKAVAPGGAIFISFMKDTKYSRFINLIRKILHAVPGRLRVITSSIISVLFLIILRVSGKRAEFKRIRTKVSAQHFPVASFSGAEEAEAFFKKMGFSVEKTEQALEIFPYATEFGLKLRRIN